MIGMIVIASIDMNSICMGWATANDQIFISSWLLESGLHLTNG